MHRLVGAICSAMLLLAACGGSDDAGDADAFCERLDRLTSNDPFAAFGDQASAEEIEIAFAALVARANELTDVAPPEVRSAANDYRDATERLDELLAEVEYTINVDPRAYREQQDAYIEAATRLERYLSSSC